MSVSSVGLAGPMGGGMADLEMRPARTLAFLDPGSDGRASGRCRPSRCASLGPLADLWPPMTRDVVEVPHSIELWTLEDLVRLAGSPNGVISTEIEFGRFLRGIAANMAVQHWAATGVTVSCHTPDVWLDSSIAICLGAVAAELMAVAHCHSFPHGRLGRLAVSCVAEEALLALVVEDSGIGTQEHSIPTAAKAIVGHLHGIIEQADVIAGTRWLVWIPHAELAN
jgi:hypothetical protein